jgi:hypothetical protein
VLSSGIVAAMSGFALVGNALQLAGLGIAAVGLTDTWRRYAPENARFMGRTRALGRSAVAFPMRQFRALIRRRSHRPVNVHVGAAEAFAVTENARVTISYGPLDPGSPEAIDRLASRTVELRTDMNRLDDRERADLDALHQDLEAMRVEMSHGIEDQKRLVQDVATGGTGLAAFGLIVTFAGTLIAGIR